MTYNRNVILGFAFNYNDDQLKPFLKSLLNTHFQGDLVLFANRKITIEKDLYPFEIKFKYPEREFYFLIWLHRAFKFFSIILGLHKVWLKINLSGAKNATTRNSRLSDWTISFLYVNYYLATCRYFFYYNFLKDNNYQKVFLTDISDVFFQGDVFEKVEKGKLSVFSENHEIPLGEERHNRGWIVEGYGEKTLEQLKKKPIYCSGTILGNNDTILAFLKDYTVHISENQLPVYMKGLDQGIFNYLIHSEKYQYINKVNNGEVVFTIGIQGWQDIIISDDKVVYSKSLNNIPKVIHQYNRHHHVVLFVQDQFYN